MTQGCGSVRGKEGPNEGLPQGFSHTDLSRLGFGLAIGSVGMVFISLVQQDLGVFEVEVAEQGEQRTVLVQNDLEALVVCLLRVKQLLEVGHEVSQSKLLDDVLHKSFSLVLQLFNKFLAASSAVLVQLDQILVFEHGLRLVTQPFQGLVEDDEVKLLILIVIKRPRNRCWVQDILCGQ